MPEEIALPFILKSQPHSTLPISKYIHTNMKLTSKAEKKINDRLKKFGSLKDLQKGIKISKADNAKFSEEFNSEIKLKDFLREKNSEKDKKIAFLTKKIDQINKDELKELVMSLLKTEDNSFLTKTNTRKFLMAYSLLTEKIYHQLP